MVSPGDEHGPAHGNGQTTRKDLGDLLRFSARLPSGGEEERKGAVNPSRGGAGVALAGVGTGSALVAPARKTRGSKTWAQPPPARPPGALWAGFPSFCPKLPAASCPGGGSGRTLLPLAALRKGQAKALGFPAQLLASLGKGLRLMGFKSRPSCGRLRTVSVADGSRLSRRKERGAISIASEQPWTQAAV